MKHLNKIEWLSGLGEFCVLTFSHEPETPIETDQVEAIFFPVKTETENKHLFCNRKNAVRDLFAAGYELAVIINNNEIWRKTETKFDVQFQQALPIF